MPQPTAPRISHQQETPPERRWVVGLAGIVLLLTTIPYLVGYARQGSEWVFSGFVFGVEDGNSYIAKMLSGESGSWLFRTPYTASPQGGVLAFLPYLLLGKLAAPPGLHFQLVALFQIFRIGAGFLAVLATYDFLSFFIRRTFLRRFGLVLAILGGGLGWILVVFGRGTWYGALPLEFYSPETFGFLSIFGIPHLALARAALLWGLLCYLNAARTGHRSSGRNHLLFNGLKIGSWWLLTSLAQPLTGLVFSGVIGLHLLVTGLWIAWINRKIVMERRLPLQSSTRRGERPASLLRHFRHWKDLLKLACLAALLPVPFLAYNFLEFNLDPFLKAWTEQNRILSPHPYHYLIAYGLILPFAFAGSVRLLRRRPWEALLLVPWVLCLPILAYAPVTVQRRLPEGIWIALVGLAMFYLESLQAGRGVASQSSPGRWFISPLLLAFPSTLILLAGGFFTALRPGFPVYRPAAEIAAFHYLQDQAQPGEIVLTSYESGNALPAWAPVRVLIGHGPESVGLADLRPLVSAFFDANTSDAYRLELLSKKDVHYVVYGPAERALGAWDPGQAAFLKQAYTGGTHQVFKVLTPSFQETFNYSETNTPDTLCTDLPHAPCSTSP